MSSRFVVVRSSGLLMRGRPVMHFRQATPALQRLGWLSVRSSVWRICAPLEGEDDVVGGEQDLVPSKVESSRIEGRPLRDQFAYPLLRVEPERHDQIDRGLHFDVFGGERAQEVGNFVQQIAAERCDQDTGLVAALEDDGRVAVQAVVSAAADPHLGQLGRGQVELDQRPVSVTCEQNLAADSQ